MNWTEFWQGVLPPLREALLLVIAAAAWTAVAYLKSMREKFEEGKNREALDSAIRTGIRAELKVNPDATDKELAIAGSKWAIGGGAPDAVRAFKLSGSDLGRKAMSAIDEERAKIMFDKKPC